ncbi:MAG TPA: PGDYG domain-containing protein [Gammaproteobacteria bacterium]|nr:PGDYG domain-containing protein [Gammaproteobacteria bacterium]
MIHTLEGPVAFEPGDYLARGIQSEEYPISPETFGALYVVDTLEPDTRGFASYRPAPLLHRAVQIAEPFSVERADGGLFTGKAGDYVVQTVGLEGARIVDRSIFEQLTKKNVSSWTSVTHCG